MINDLFVTHIEKRTGNIFFIHAPWFSFTSNFQGYALIQFVFRRFRGQNSVACALFHRYTPPRILRHYQTSWRRHMVQREQPSTGCAGHLISTLRGATCKGGGIPCNGMQGIHRQTARITRMPCNNSLRVINILSISCADGHSG